MSKMNIKIACYAICLLAILSSCVDDKGNYEYDNISVPEYDQTTETITLAPSEPVLIEPVITYTDGIGLNNFTYEWVWYDPAAATVGGTLISQSTETSRLSIDRLPDKINRPGTYQVYLKLTNNITGVLYIKPYTFVVKNRIQTGYLALSEKTSGLELNMISPVLNDGIEELVFIPDLLNYTSSSYPKEGRKPIGLYTYPDQLAPDPFDTNTARLKYSVFILTDKSTDRVKAEDFSFIDEKYNLSRTCYIPAMYKPERIIAEKMNFNRLGSAVYAYISGNWYFSIYNAMGSLFFSYPVNRYKNDVKAFATAPYIVSSSDGSNGSAVIYNEDEKYFAQQKYVRSNLNSDINSVMSSTKVEDKETDEFRFNNPNYELFYMDNKSIVTTGTDGFIIVKNKSTSKYELLIFKLNTSGEIANKLRRDIPTFIDVSNIKYYSSHPSEPILYMATEDRLYSFLYSGTNQNMVVTDITDKVVPAGHKISCMNHMGLKNASSLRQVIGIGTYNLSASLDVCGTLQFFEINSYDASLTLAKHPTEPTEGVVQIDMKWNGLGKIVGLDYKQQ